MASRIRLEMQRSNLMTQDIEHLFNDLNNSIDYCLKNCEQYVSGPLSRQIEAAQRAGFGFGLVGEQSRPLRRLRRLRVGLRVGVGVSVSVELGVPRGVGRGDVARRGAARVQQPLRRAGGARGAQEIKEMLGSGAYSVVYAAVDKQTHQRYAVKCIKKRDLQKSDVQSLKNEVFIMGQVGARRGGERSWTTRTSCGWRASTTTRTTTTSCRSWWTVGPRGRGEA